MATTVNFFCLLLLVHGYLSISHWTKSISYPFIGIWALNKIGHHLNVPFMQIAMVQLCTIPILTYVECVCNPKHLASSVKWKTHCILVHEWDMKLGIAPLQSAWKYLSNDVLKVDFNVGHIFAKNRTQAKAIIHGFSWFWVKIQLTAKWTSTLHSCWSQWCKSHPHISFLAQDT